MKLQIGYAIYINKQFITKVMTYFEALEIKENFENRFKKAKVDIVDVMWYE